MRKIFLYLSSLWLVFIFLFLPHYVELTGVLETWFPAKGLIYYKDFAAYHFPLGRLILLPLHLISDWNLELDPWVGLFTGLGTLYIIYLFGKRFLSNIGTAIALIFFSVFFWYAATGILFFHEILIGFLLAWITYLLFKFHTERKTGKRLLFFLGILIALAELSGQIATITLGVVFILILYKIAQKQTKDLKASVLTLTAGISLPFLLFSLYFLSKGALWEFYYYNIPYYLLYAGYEKSSLLSLPLGDLLAFYMPLMILAFLSVLLFIKKKQVDYQTKFILLLTLSTIPFIFFSVYHPHHLNYALPVLAIAAGFSYDKIKQYKIIFMAGAVIFLLISLTSLIPWHIERIKFPPSFRIANDLYPDSKDPMKDTVDWVKDNTAQDAKIMVMGDPLFYLRSNRLPASRPSKSIPYGWEPEIIRDEILASRSDYWIVDTSFTLRLIEVYRRPDMVDFLKSELEFCYERVAVFDNWEIWEKVCE